MASAVVVPNVNISASRLRAPSTRSCSLASRVAARRVVEGEERLVDVGVAEWPGGARRYFVGAAGAVRTIAWPCPAPGGSGEEFATVAGPDDARARVYRLEPAPFDANILGAELPRLNPAWRDLPFRVSSQELGEIRQYVLTHQVPAEQIE